VEQAMVEVSWPGRMQKLTQGRLVDLAPPGAEIWLDGGHNPDAGMVIAEAMAEQEEKTPRSLFLISGIINTKDQSGYLHSFKGLVRHVYTVPGSFSDAGVPNDELAARATEAGLSAEPVSSVANALMLLRDTWDSAEVPPRILIGGSLYLAGTVLAENGTPPE
jgi:dihydrofolate synthase/folylpolyglutamate synthase